MIEILPSMHGDSKFNLNLQHYTETNKQKTKGGAEYMDKKSHDQAKKKKFKLIFMYVYACTCGCSALRGQKRVLASPRAGN